MQYLQGKCPHLDEQIDLFEDTVKSKLPTYFDISQQLSDYLSKSVFVISTGSNDYMCNYLQPRSFNTSKIYAPQPFAQLLIDALSRKLEVQFSSFLYVRNLLAYDDVFSCICRGYTIWERGR